jgi:hypothetical protein
LGRAHDAAPDAVYATEHGIELVDTLFREADFVSVNAPLTPAARRS